MSAKRETPRVAVKLWLEPETLAMIDKARGGTMSRNAWIERALTADRAHANNPPPI